MTKTSVYTFEEFKEEFSKILSRTYGITIGDCTDENELMQEFKDGASPEDFVEFLGSKFDLDPIN